MRTNWNLSSVNHVLNRLVQQSSAVHRSSRRSKKDVVFKNRSKWVQYSYLLTIRRTLITVNKMKSPLSTRKYLKITWDLNICYQLVWQLFLTQIWHLAAALTCVGMMQWSQANVLYYNYSTPGQTKAHAVLYSSQECVHNSFYMPRFSLPIMRQKKGIPFYSSALVKWWTSVSLKFLSNELFCSQSFMTTLYLPFHHVIRECSPYLWPLCDFITYSKQYMLTQQSRFY